MRELQARAAGCLPSVPSVPSVPCCHETRQGLFPGAAPGNGLVLPFSRWLTRGGPVTFGTYLEANSMRDLCQQLVSEIPDLSVALFEPLSYATPLCRPELVALETDRCAGRQMVWEEEGRAEGAAGLRNSVFQ